PTPRRRTPSSPRGRKTSSARRCRRSASSPSSARTRRRDRASPSCSRRTTTWSRRWPEWRAANGRVGAAGGARGPTRAGPGGAGGGGSGYGHIYGAGNLDTGGRGHKGAGRGPKLAERGEHEVSVGMGNGGGDTDGSLSKEQILKVVRAHMAGVKYCYEKELQ